MTPRFDGFAARRPKPRKWVLVEEQSGKRTRCLVEAIEGRRYVVVRFAPLVRATFDMGPSWDGQIPRTLYAYEPNPAQRGEKP